MAPGTGLGGVAWTALWSPISPRGLHAPGAAGTTPGRSAVGPGLEAQPGVGVQTRRSPRLTPDPTAGKVALGARGPRGWPPRACSCRVAKRSGPRPPAAARPGRRRPRWRAPGGPQLSQGGPQLSPGGPQLSPGRLPAVTGDPQLSPGGPQRSPGGPRSSGTQAVESLPAVTGRGGVNGNRARHPVN